MKTETIVMCVVALLLGMLLANMLKDVCGCKTVEGQNANDNSDDWNLEDLVCIKGQFDNIDEEDSQEFWHLLCNLDTSTCTPDEMTKIGSMSALMSVCDDPVKLESLLTPNDPLKQDCEGYWEPCTRACEGGAVNSPPREFNVTTPAAHGGKACPSPAYQGMDPVTKQFNPNSCGPGMGDCTW